jgi:hypothetical protein
VSGTDNELIGRGEWIRTTDLLVPNQGPTPDQQLSADHRSCDSLLLVDTSQQLKVETGPECSNLSQPLYAQTGHSIGHSPDISSIIDRSVPSDVIIRDFLQGKYPEEMCAKNPGLRLWQAYGVIALFLRSSEENLH